MSPINIYIVGAQCTGKTTLVNALADHFKDPENRIHQNSRIPEPALIKEVARGVLQRHHFTAFDITSSAERALQLQELILEAQHEAEMIGDRWFISDRSGVDPIVYAGVYVSKDASSNMLSNAISNDLCSRMRKGLVFICQFNRDWLHDDGVRLMPKDVEEWANFHRVFCDLLDHLEIDHTVLRGDLTVQERRDVVLQRWHSS